MKRIGRLLLIIGFTWIAAQQFSGLLRFGARPVLDAQYSKLSPDPAYTYSANEVREFIRETVLATYDLFPLIIVPGILMLVGGVLVGRGARTSESERAQQGIQPDGPASGGSAV